MNTLKNLSPSTAPRGFFPVVAALSGNFILMIAKFFGFFVKCVIQVGPPGLIGTGLKSGNKLMNYG